MSRKEPHSYFRDSWQAAPAWVWLATGLILGVAVLAVAAYLFVFALPDKF